MKQEHSSVEIISKGMLVTLGVLLSTGCSVFGVRTAEELPYTVLVEEDNFEIRRYAPHLAAETTQVGPYDTVQRTMFRRLAGYIFGKNSNDDSIAMTAPVVVNEQSYQTNRSKPDDTSERIAMTAPVTVGAQSEDTWTMRFSMPAKFTMETLPKPLDTRVRIVEVPAKTVAVVTFSGRFGHLASRKKYATELQEWIKTSGTYQALGTPFYAGYDPPFTLPFLRRNEALVEVRPR